MTTMQQSPEPPRVHVVATGGTIAMTDDDTGLKPRLSATDLVESVPQLGQVARITTATHGTVPGAHLRLHDIRDIVIAAQAAIADGCAGVVVIQGTDTLEETVFLADLLLGEQPSAPVVFTGAMRGSEQLGADGAANILASVRAAADPATREQGAMLCMNGELHAARTVTKSHAFSLAAFTSPMTGPLGWIAEDRVRLHGRIRPGRRFDAATLPDELPPIALHRVSLGDDAGLLAGLAGSDYRGLVVEAFGAGHVSAGLAETLASISATMPVVVATRTGNGEVLRQTYGFPGSEIDLWRRGMIPAGSLDGLKARLLLAVSVAARLDRIEVERAFESWST